VKGTETAVPRNAVALASPSGIAIEMSGLYVSDATTENVNRKWGRVHQQYCSWVYFNNLCHIS
jgi:hypothetical protein